MTRVEIMGKLQAIFVQIFDDETLNITEETSAKDIDDWDSLEQINIIVSIESEFKIKIQIEDTFNLLCVGDMVDLIIKKIEN